MLTSTDLDSPAATIQHAHLIRTKPFLRRIYREHYDFFASQLTDVPSGTRLEIGSGGGFIKEVIPNAVTSDVIAAPKVDLVCTGLALPFAEGSLAAIMMLNVFHHLPDVATFLLEARRCLLPGGKVLMIEPANTPWSRFVYSNFHHEPFDPTQDEWQLPPGGRMSAANDALAWIVFYRDRDRFDREYPDMHIGQSDNFMPLRYLCSGGLSKPQFVPSWMYSSVKYLERLVSPLNNFLGMFMRIVLVKQ